MMTKLEMCKAYAKGCSERADRAERELESQLNANVAMSDERIEMERERDDARRALKRIGKAFGGASVGTIIRALEENSDD